MKVGGQIPLASGVYEKADIYDFRSGDYANAVFLKVTTEGVSSASLTVSAEGVVGTDTGGITLVGLHTITVKAASEGDYAGNARLELVLELVKEGELSSADTIPTSELLRPVAPGYAGSVAFFAAIREGGDAGDAGGSDGIQLRDGRCKQGLHVAGRVYASCERGRCGCGGRHGDGVF